jgi:hypothetical protein
VNSHIKGMSYGKASKYPNYFAITTRYSQIIYNTDIVLRTPGGASTPRISYILDALLPDDGIYGKDNDFSDAYNKQWTPTVKIIGGHMFVGAGQNLYIGGGRINTNPASPGEHTLTVSPSSLTVENGGLVSLASSEYTNVTTDMHINGKVTLTGGAKAGGKAVVGSGGALEIGDAARYDGNIYVGRGGTLTISSGALVGDIRIANGGAITIGAGAVITGDVRCAGKMKIMGDISLNYSPTSGNPADNPSTADIDESEVVGGKYIYHGIFIYSDPEVGVGELTLAGAPAINGTSGRIHTFAGCLAIPRKDSGETFCNNCSNKNVCRHWTLSSGVWSRVNDSSGV